MPRMPTNRLTHLALPALPLPPIHHPPPPTPHAPWAPPRNPAPPPRAAMPRLSISPLTPLALLALALSACRPAPPRNPMAQWVPSPNFGPRQPILIVIHATEQESVQESLDTLRTENSGGPVSSHYLVGDNGDIYQLVADQNRAWRSEEHTSELQSLMRISYAVFCLKKKKKN